MDEIEQRLRAATDACITSYDSWRKNPKDGTARAALMESVHEIRKVAARLEIEIAISERDEMASRPIPIPPHRSSRKRSSDDIGYDDNIGNMADDDGEQPSSHRGGGSGAGGGQRRHAGRGGRSGGPQGGQPRRQHSAQGQGGNGGGNGGGSASADDAEG